MHRSPSQPPAEPAPRRTLIAVVGDAALELGSAKERLAESVGAALVEAGYRVLTGGLGGVMEAACRGARSAAAYHPGDTIGIVPGHDPAQANPFVDVAIASGLDHARNVIVAHAEALVAIGGGAGTLAELCFAWIYNRLIVALRIEGWSGRLADQRLDDRTRFPDISDDRIYGASDATDVVRILHTHLPRYRRHHPTP